MIFRKCTKEEFISAISDNKEDSFAKTFVAKANTQNQWEYCIGAFTAEGELMGAIITTISKREPKTANLQLLHTFFKFRRMGVGKSLTEKSFKDCFDEGIVYFRVSAEPSAVVFYESLGMKFWGKQKSGCSLCIFAVGGEKICEGIYNESDPFIKKSLYSGRKGSLASSYSKGVDLSAFLD